MGEFGMGGGMGEYGMGGGGFYNDLMDEEDEHRDFSHTEFNNGQRSNTLGLIHPTS